MSVRKDQEGVDGDQYEPAYEYYVVVVECIVKLVDIPNGIQDVSQNVEIDKSEQAKD